MLSNIVFTKNRPLQLEAYLESLYRYFPSELIRTYILYKVELFDRQYEQLFRRYPDCVVIREQDFHGDFLNLLGQINTQYILFGIDDVVYFDSVDFDLIDATFRRNSRDILGFTLRFSPESLGDSDDTITEISIAGQMVYRLDWRIGTTPHTRYPFELCCTVYPTDFVKKIVGGVVNGNPLIKRLFAPNSILINALGKLMRTRPILKNFGYFYSPNTLESWCCRWCQNHSDRLPGFSYFQKLCAAPVQVNMVNTSTKNTFDGTDDHTVESLNEKFKQGYRFDIDYLSKNKPSGLSCGREYFRLIQRSL